MEYWTILIASDDENVHRISKKTIEGFEFENKAVECISAYTDSGVRRTISARPKTAVVLLDAVMDKTDAGFGIIRYIRNTLENRMVRIVLFAEKPDEAPVASAIIDYDINDYKLKNELTRKEFFTTIVLALRTYRDLIHLEKSRREIKRLCEREAQHSYRLKTNNERLQKEIREHRRTENALRFMFEKRQQLENIVNHCPVVVFLRENEPGLPFEFVSESVTRYGYSPEDFTSGRVKIAHIVHPEDLPRVIREVKEYARKESDEFNQEYRILTRNKEVRWTDVRTLVRRDENGRVTHYQGIMIDVTLNRQMEKEKMERQIAEASARSKSAFLANMSHEIRTPMNAIIGLTDLMFKTDMSVKQADYMSKIRSTSKSLLRIINDILDLSKIEAKKLNLESVNFNLWDVMENLSGLFSGITAGKGNELILSVEEDVPCALIGDPYRLGQILVNLTGNAVKFTEKGEVVVKARVREMTDEKVTLLFSVKDNGVGIPSEKIAVLFDSFTQVDDSITRKYGGAGLGLSICKQLVKMMGGSIWVKSEEGRGSVFFFTARFQRQTDVCELGEALPESLRDIRVLVVDDNKTSREFLKELLNRFSLDVTTVDSGKAALEELRKTEENNSYRLVLMDWLMPEMDGLEAIKQIRNDNHVKRVPTIIMVTAYNLDEVMNRVKKEKVDAFLFKPVEQTLLLDTIKEVLGFETERGKEKKSLSLPVHQADVLDHIRWSRVLVVEDNPTNQQVVRELLESAGVIVKVANNGQEAIRTLSEFDFDVVLMDVQMPVMDGYETTRLLRQEPAFANLPIIALTAHALEREQKKCFEAGMNDYLAKPINADQLYSILSKWTKNKEDPPPDAELETDTFQNGNGEWLLLESVPWIDIPAAAAKLRGNRGLLKKLIMEFPRDYSDYAGRIGEAMQNGERENAYRLVHTIKGIAGQIAAHDLQKATEKMEEAIEKGDAKDFDSFLNRFETALQNVLESIAHIKTAEENQRPDDRAIPPNNEVCDISEVISFFVDLSLLLEENDLNAEDFFLSRKNCLSGLKIDNKVEKLEDSIGRLDYSRALECIAEISHALNISI